MKKIILSACLIFPLMAAADFKEQVSMGNFPVAFENNTRFDVVVNPSTEKPGCIIFQTTTIPANSKKTLMGKTDQCNPIFVSVTSFYINPRPKTNRWKIENNKANIYFTCGTDMGGCSSEMRNFPILMKNKITKVKLHLNAVDQGIADPFTFEINQSE